MYPLCLPAHPPDNELVVKWVILGGAHPVRVSCQHFDGSCHVSCIPKLDLPIATGCDEHLLLVRIEIDTPVNVLYALDFGRKWSSKNCDE